jgi:opacity protein-like surface antigen
LAKVCSNFAKTLEAFMLRQGTIVLATLAFGSVSAVAADLAKAPPYQPAYQQTIFSWTGFYVGAGGGFQAVTATGTGVSGANATATLWYATVDGGYRYQLPDNLVLGLDVFAPVWVSKGSSSPPGVGGVDSAKVLFAVVPEAQIGYAFGRFLPYFGVGVGVADVRVNLNPAFGTTGTDTEPDVLLAVTFGVDYALTDNWSVGVRYDHIQAETTNYTFPAVPVPHVTQVGATMDGLAGVLRYKF